MKRSMFSLESADAKNILLIGDAPTIRDRVEKMLASGQKPLADFKVFLLSNNKYEAHVTGACLGQIDALRYRDFIRKERRGEI